MRTARLATTEIDKGPAESAESSRLRGSVSTDIEPVTRTRPVQIDLFERPGSLPDAAVQTIAASHGGLRSKRRRPSGERVPARFDPEAMACALETSGRYRILRQLQPRPVVPAPAARADGSKIGIVLDTETTGLDPTKDEIIELGMVAFRYDEHEIGDVVGVFSALREPAVPISAEITRITGITAEMVAGQAINLDAVADFIADADLVIAHNAKFDRPFCERFAPGFDVLPWACSVAEIDWAALGFEGSKLGYLVGQCGWFHNGHRAVDDFHALLEVLATSRRNGQPAPFGELLISASKRRCRIWAEGSPFHTKDVLKGRGYRRCDGSNGQLKSWWIEVPEDAFADEMAFLRDEIYRAAVEPYVQWLTATDRFKR